MDTIISYFSDMPTTHRSLMLVGGLGFFMLLESGFPFFKIDYNRWKHTGINLFFTLTTVLVNFLLAFLLISSSEWVTTNEFGLIHWLQLSSLPTLLLGVLLMDFIGAWLIHFLEHKIPLLWRFHIIHHTDRHVDTTTANRHHPGESIFRFAFTALAIFLVGAPIWLIFVYQSMSLVATQVTHSNLNYPKWLDLLVGWLFVTPRMHRVHHHYRMPYSDTNYGNIFSIWDRIFQTFVVVDNAKLKYGLDTHLDYKETNNILNMLAIPFQKYKGHIEYAEEEKL